MFNDVSVASLARLVPVRLFDGVQLVYFERNARRGICFNVGQKWSVWFFYPF
jgi:hypothetical protein